MIPMRDSFNKNNYRASPLSSLFSHKYSSKLGICSKIKMPPLGQLFLLAESEGLLLPSVVMRATPFEPWPALRCKQEARYYA
ncbi:MAG: hypothetical protein JW723_03795 [Bacteroidales bacterium]|nr:hypothetical protein [Bacteroidales bacterium]